MNIHFNSLIHKNSDGSHTLFCQFCWRSDTGRLRYLAYLFGFSSSWKFSTEVIEWIFFGLLSNCRDALCENSFCLLSFWSLVWFIPLPRSDSVHSNISNVTGIQIPNSLHWFLWNFLIFPPHENVVPFCCKLQKLKPFGFFYTVFIKIFPWTGPQILPLSSIFPLLVMPQRQGDGLFDIYRYFCCSPSQWCQLTTWQ